MKKKVIFILLVTIIVGVIFGIIYSQNQKIKNTDAYKFKVEYEKLNGKESSSGKTIRTLNIPVNNRIKYSTAKEIVKKIDNGDSFVVYFGFASCPWCRSMINNLIDLSNEYMVDVYYVDVQNIRDELQVVNGKVTRTKDGDKYYMELLDRLDEVLSDYSLTVDDVSYETNEKRIYAPNVVAITNGKTEKLTEGISEKLTDPYEELTDEMIKESKEQLECIFKCMEKAGICIKENAC